MNKNIKVSSLIVIMLLLFSSCGPSACDCANLYDDYSMDKAKKCALEYGELDSVHKEIARDILEANMIPGVDKAITNASKICATEKDFSKSELELSCQCWNQSVRKTGMAYDNMTNNQQQFRNNCFDIFKDEVSMEIACQKSKNK